MIRSLNFLLILFTLLCPLWVAAIPMTLTHQGHIIASDNTPMTGAFTVTFALYEQAEGGSAIWNESFPVVFDSGYYSVILGIDNALSPSDFTSDSLFLGVTLQGSTEMEPRHQITSVPFAFKAGEVVGRVDAQDGLFVGGEEVINSDGAWIGGEIQIAPTDTSCTSNTAGTLKWNTSLNRLEVCNGSLWEAVGTGSGSGSASIPEILSV